MLLAATSLHAAASAVEAEVLSFLPRTPNILWNQAGWLSAACQSDQMILRSCRLWDRDYRASTAEQVAVVLVMSAAGTGFVSGKNDS